MWMGNLISPSSFLASLVFGMRRDQCSCYPKKDITEAIIIWLAPDQLERFAVPGVLHPIRTNVSHGIPFLIMQYKIKEAVLSMWASALCICFYINPALLNGSTQFHYCTDSNPGTGADVAFVLKRGVWRNATWPLHSRPAIAASARHFQICFLH